MSLLSNMLSGFVIDFLLRSKCLNFMAAVITICSDFGAQENKVCHCFHYFLIYLTWSLGTDTMIFVFLMLSFKPVFSLSPFTFIKRLYPMPDIFFLFIFHTIASVFQLHLISLAFYCSLNLLFLGELSYLVPAIALSWCLFSLSFWHDSFFITFPVSSQMLTLNSDSPWFYLWTVFLKNAT